MRKALLALKDENNPSLDRGTTVRLLLDHIPLAITGGLERSASQEGAAKAKCEKELAYDCLLAAAGAVDESRRWQDACVYAHGRCGVDSKTEGAKVRGLAILEDSEAVPDRGEACLWLLGGKFEHILGLFRWDLLAHDLTRDDIAKFHRDISAAANFNTQDLWVPEVDLVCLSEVLGDSLRTALTKRELEGLRPLKEEPFNDTGILGRSCG